MLTAGDGGFGVSKAQPTFFDAIADHAARDQDRPAIISSGTDPLSLGELVTLIGGIWETLREAGVGNGSQVAIALPSGLESVISTVTIASYATCVPLNPNLTQGEIDGMTRRLGLLPRTGLTACSRPPKCRRRYRVLRFGALAP
jgi:acyl-CoA synthetase (AMP-forming)/AMP-acid ligase II